MNFKKRDRRWCLSKGSRSDSQLIATHRRKNPRKDPAVHVSLPSDAIVKQQALSGQDLPQPTSLRRIAPENPNLEPQSLNLETKTGEKPTRTPPSPSRKSRPDLSPLKPKQPNRPAVSSAATRRPVAAI